VKDWDKRVEEASHNYFKQIHDPQIPVSFCGADYAIHCGFTAGANFARGLLTDTPGGKRIYAALNEIDALSLQCEAMAEALDFCMGAMKNEMVSRGLPLEWSKGSGLGVAERALSAYKKFKEGG
jgi:hypothetical protein